MSNPELKKKAVLWLILIAVGAWIGYRFNSGEVRTRLPAEAYSAMHETEHTEERHADRDHANTIYVCPMMCIPARNIPGDCPVCGMELVPAVGAGESETGPPGLTLSADAIKLAGIQTAAAARKFVSASVHLFGKIDYDPAHMTEITAFMPGVIDRIYVKRAGQFVRWGEPLFDLYSSDLLETQQQLIEVMKYVPSFLAFQAGTPHTAREMPVQERLSSGTNPSPEAEAALKKLAGIRHKLSILGLPKRDIDELMKKGQATGIATIYSSMYGQVIDQRAFEGSYINTGTPIFTIGDPDYVWVKMDAYESDYSWLRKGQEVTFETDAYPGEIFTAKVVYIDPVFNNTTRTFGIGAVCSNSKGRLKAGMLVRAEIHARMTAAGNVANENEEIGEAPLVIPASAPLITGKRAVVYVESPTEPGRFEGREVTLGARAGDFYIVLNGLREGELVVENGSFKIDSSLQILAKPSMMTIGSGHSAIGHHNPGDSYVLQQNYLDKRAESRTTEPSNFASKKEAYEDERAARVNPHERRVIQRRKPGAYGDGTRRLQRAFK